MNAPDLPVAAHHNLKSGKEVMPYFPVFPKDVLSDYRLRSMTLEQIGAYFRLCCICWLDRSIPCDHRSLAKALMVSTKKTEALLDALEPFFRPVEIDDRTVLVHTELEAIRASYEARRENSSDIGRRGAAARWSRSTSRQQGETVVPRHCPGSALAVQDDGLSHSPSDSRPHPPSHPVSTRPAAGSSEALVTATEMEFERFWDAFPRKQGKSAARRAWQGIHPDPELQDRIFNALDAQRRSTNWLKDAGRFIPSPARWLSDARWEDELTQAPSLSERTVEALSVGKVFLSSLENNDEHE